MDQRDYSLRVYPGLVEWVNLRDYPDKPLPPPCERPDCQADELCTECTRAANDSKRKRGKVSSFSRGARQRLLRELGKVDWRSLPGSTYFVSLTYGNLDPTGEESKTHLDSLLKRLRRLDDSLVLWWRMEFQENRRRRDGGLRIHYHILFSSAEISAYQIPRLWQEITGDTHPNFAKGQDVRPMTSIRGAMRYLAKYCSKPSGSSVSSQDIKTVEREIDCLYDQVAELRWVLSVLSEPPLEGVRRLLRLSEQLNLAQEELDGLYASVVHTWNGRYWGRTRSSRCLLYTSPSPRDS